MALSRNTLDNQADKYEDNENPVDNERTLLIKSRETENKLRCITIISVDSNLLIALLHNGSI
jgi:hypothetical protein